MKYLELTLLVLFYLFSPAVIIYFSSRYLLLKKAGHVMIAYILGLVIGNIGILPEGSKEIQNALSSISIPLAVPLLLMSLNIGSWTGMARHTMKSLLSGVVAVVVVVIIGNMIFMSWIPDSWKISGMLVGVYTGGTANLASIKTALGVDDDLYILTHTSDIISSALYLLFLMTFAKPLFKKWLPYDYFFAGRFKDNEPNYSQFENYNDIFKSYNLIPTLGALAVSILILIVGVGVMYLVPESAKMAVVILVITTLGIYSSTIPTLRRAPRSFEFGMYLILIFSLVVSSMADVSKFTMNILPIFSFVTFTIFGTLFLHLLIAKFFQVDRDTMMITSTALICSPPFVPMVAGVLGNRQIIISGITVGIVGYAIGNYLGIMVAYLLH